MPLKADETGAVPVEPASQTIEYERVAELIESMPQNLTAPHGTSSGSVPTPTWLHRLNLTIYLAPPLLLLVVEMLRQQFDLSWNHYRWWYVALLAACVVGMLQFARLISGVVGRVHTHEVYQNEELLALHQASLAIASDLELGSVLQRVVNESSVLIGARYGAISYFRNSPIVDAFVTYGVTDEQSRLIGHPPIGRGVLGIPIVSGDTLRLDHIGLHPSSVGFPPHHPPMETLLAVPIETSFGVVGNLYLSDVMGSEPFNEEDEASLQRFAALAAIAIENAVLHNQVEVLAITNERDRIAREMHDSLSQILAYVSTKSQAALAYLKRENPEAASHQIEELAAAAREAYVDVREGIFALRSASHSEHDTSVIESLAEYVAQWQLQQQIPVNFVTDQAEAPGEIAPLARVHLLRLVQEALSNVRKHANASQVDVRITRSEVQWCIVVQDNGRGFDPETKPRGELPRFGLSSMRERAEASGGTFELNSVIGTGTTVTVTLPTMTA